MGKPATHRLDVFGAHLHVATTREQIAVLREKYELADSESIGASYLTIDTESNNAIHLTVWVDVATLDGADLIDTIAHEAVHTAAQLLDHIGQSAGQHDSEVLAYLAGWVAARIWESAA